MVIDFFDVNTKTLKARFFSDKSQNIIYIVDDKKWTQKTIVNAFLKDGKSYSYKKDLELAGRFLGHSGWYWCYSCNKNLHGMESLCARAAKDYGSKKREKARERADELQKKHFNMFPKLPGKKLDKFCDDVAFSTSYIFFGNKQKNGKREVVCGHCGKKYLISSNIKHNEKCVCKFCNKQGIYCAARYASSKRDKSKVVISNKYQNQLILEWVNVFRYYTEKGTPQFNYESASKVLYLIENGRPKIYSYNFQHVMFYWGNYWVKKETLPHCKAYVYTGNLNTVFEDGYCHVNLEQVFKKYPVMVDFVKLLDNLKTDPATEYLCKLGLVVLASERTNYGIDRTVKKFEDIIGVSKQLLPIYQKYQPTLSENDIIKAAAQREFISEERFKAIRKLHSSVEFYERDYIVEVLEHTTLTKMQNYLTKQLSYFSIYTTGQILRWWRDYINMCIELSISLNKHTLFPPNIKKYHDILAKRVRELRAANEKAASEAALKIVNRNFKGYSNGVFTVKVPKERADFIREGQELSHCVGAAHYYENHIKGERMIFFIRSSIQPDKPLYTAEIDMNSFNILQLYGFGDSAAPATVKKFVKDFAKWLKAERLKLYKQKSSAENVLITA